MSNCRLNPDEFVKFTHEIMSKANTESTYRRIMSGCYYAPKLLAWYYAEKNLGKSLRDIAKKYKAGTQEATDDLGFLLMMKYEVDRTDRTIMPCVYFLRHGRLAADHNIETICQQYAWRVICDKNEAKQAIKYCEKLVTKIRKKFAPSI